MTRTLPTDTGENVSEEDACLRCALDAGVADVVGFSEGEGFGADDAGERCPIRRV